MRAGRSAGFSRSTRTRAAPADRWRWPTSPGSWRRPAAGADDRLGPRGARPAPLLPAVPARRGVDRLRRPDRSRRPLRHGGDPAGRCGEPAETGLVARVRRLQRLRPVDRLRLLRRDRPARLPARRTAGRRLRAEGQLVQLAELLRPARRRRVLRSVQAARARGIRLRPHRQPNRRQRHRWDLLGADAGHAGGLLHLQQPEHQGRRRRGAVGARPPRAVGAGDAIGRGRGVRGSGRHRGFASGLPHLPGADARRRRRERSARAAAGVRARGVSADARPPGRRPRRLLEPGRGAAQRLLRLRGGAGGVQGQAERSEDGAVRVRQDDGPHYRSRRHRLPSDDRARGAATLPRRVRRHRSVSRRQAVVARPG